MLRVLMWILGSLAALALALFIAFKVSPWPGALAIRTVFDIGGARLAAALQKHVPPGISAALDVVYDPADEDARLDIFVPADAGAALPVIFWTHGGGFVAGDKKDVTPYLKILADAGYVAVGINYTVAPGAQYPAPLRQMDRAMVWVQANIAAYGGDPARIVMAGDSAGAQLTAQYAALATDPAYAGAVGITPSLGPDRLRAVLLFCGIYDAMKFENAKGLLAIFLDVVMRSYFGSGDRTNPKILEFSIGQHVGAAFPPAFITVGNADPLEPQSRDLAAKLMAEGVAVETLFYDAAHEPKLPHEYQYDPDGADGREALKRVLAFLTARTQ